MMPNWSLGLYLAPGLLLGTAYFRSVHWTAGRLATGRGMKLAVVVVISRFVLLGGALALTSRQGALPLLLTALGVFIARGFVLRQARMAGA